MHLLKITKERKDPFSRALRKAQKARRNADKIRSSSLPAPSLSRRRRRPHGLCCQMTKLPRSVTPISSVEAQERPETHWPLGPVPWIPRAAEAVHSSRARARPTARARSRVCRTRTAPHTHTPFNSCEKSGWLPRKKRRVPQVAPSHAWFGGCAAGHDRWARASFRTVLISTSS